MDVYVVMATLDDEYDQGEPSIQGVTSSLFGATALAKKTLDDYATSQQWLRERKITLELVQAKLPTRVIDNLIVHWQALHKCALSRAYGEAWIERHTVQP